MHCNRERGRYEWAELPDTFLDALPEIETALSAIARAARGIGRRRGHRQLRAPCARIWPMRWLSLRELPDEAGLRWVEVGANGLTLQFTPFEIAERLREYVESRPCAWIFTSATLAIGDGFFTFCREDRAARRAHAVHRQSLRLSRPGAALSAAAHAGSAGS